jgi:hypothetical protein
MAHRAQDTFVATLPDGTMRRVSKGDILADNDEMVKHDQAGDGVLFVKLNFDEAEEPAPKAPRGRKAAS